MKTKITTPNPQFTGEVGGVHFTNGAGETEDPQMVDWFSRRGYTVENSEGTEVAGAHPATGGITLEGHEQPEVGNQEPDEKLDGKGTADESNATVNDGEPAKTPSDNAGASGTTAEEQVEGAHVPDTDSEEDTRTKDELKDELRKLELPVSGSKDELLARLNEAQND